jgi:lysophospholipase L1-like esterase
MKQLFLLFFSWWPACAGCLAQTGGFEAEIRAFERADSLAPPPSGRVLLWGSSSFRFWATCQADLAPFPVVNRGFGGSQMTDAIAYLDRAVVPHRPGLLLVYEGDNDLAAGKSPQEVAQDFAKLVLLARQRLPGLQVGFVAIKPSPLRANLLAQQAEANRLVEAFCRQGKGLYFIDVASPMLDAAGQPRPDLFIGDKLHMNRSGYEVWVKVVKKFLQEKFRP